MAEDEGASKASTWLGLGVSILAVLAFFGITSFDELKRAVLPHTADLEACDQAYESGSTLTAYYKFTEEEKEFGEPTSSALRSHGTTLQKAADTAEDDDLKDYLRDDASLAIIAGERATQKGKKSDYQNYNQDWKKHCAKIISENQ